ALACGSDLSWHLGPGTLPIPLPACPRIDGCTAHAARMVSARCPARPVGPPQFPLATIKPELAVVRLCGRNAVGASGLLCRARHFCARTTVPRRANQVAPADRLAASAPATGAPVRPPAPWSDSLAPAGRGGLCTAPTLAGQHLVQTVALG